MASGWTTSGIDWTSAATMRESRTEDIVREIYLAVNERDYWVKRIKFLEQTATPPVLDVDGRIRTNQALFYIQNTVSGWLLPSADIGTRLDFVSTTVSMESFCCFLDDSFTPAGTPSIFASRILHYFGFNNLDYSAGGNFETQFSIDLSLLRNPPSRVDLNYLKMIYDILQLDLKTSADSWTVSNFGTGDRFFCDGVQLTGDIDSDDEYRFFIQDDNSAQGVNFAQIVTHLNNNTNLVLATSPTTNDAMIYTTPTFNSLKIKTTRTMLAYKIKGKTLSYDIKDLGATSITTSGFNRDPLNLMPYSNFNHGYYKNVIFIDNLSQNRINDAVSRDPIIKDGDYYVTEDIKTTFDPFTIGSATGSSTALSYTSFFINFNNEDFLNYYTESTP